jgi:hypothetical protein
MKRKFGRDHVADERDLKHAIPLKTTRKKFRTWTLGPQTDQLDTPHCVGHAWYGWLSSSPIRQRPIAPDGLYKLAQHFDEWEGQDYEGTSVRGAAKVLALTGHIKEYVWAFDLDVAVTHVLETGPIVLGLNWYTGMMDTDDEWFIRPTGSLQGGHAVLCYEVDLPRGRLKIRNSWGVSWGVNGCAYLDLADFARLLAEDGECCAAIEARSI